MMNGSDEGSNNPSQNENENEQRRKGKGRQKITMAKIENETSLQVTFSKRRGGVFKKASELTTLCGAESAVVIFSPGNKPHSFGHPDVETVANRFLNPAATGDGAPPSRSSAANQLIMAHSQATMQQRNHELEAVEAELERERRRRKMEQEGGGQMLRPPPLEELDYEQLDRLRKSVLGFKSEFEAKVESGRGSSSADSGGGAHLGFPLHGYGGGSGSSYGYTVQYPPIGDGGASNYNYGNPPSVVQYDAATASDADTDGDADDRSRFQGFGPNF